MTKQEVYDFLKNKNTEFEITEHKAVYNMKELSEVEIPNPEYDAKNLFVRDDKRNNFYLITVIGSKRADLKRFRKENGTKPLTFASEDDLNEILGLKAGSVSPLGLLNDKDLRVKFYIDSDFFKGKSIIGVHPNDNTATVWLKTEDLINIIKENGNQVYITDF